MGRSISVAVPDVLPNGSMPAQVSNERLNRHFDIFSQDGKVYQSEFATGSDANEIFRDTREVRWFIGSGINGYGPVVERDHYLFQGPVSFYTKPGQWGASPGYEYADLGFNRPILPGCMFCHSGRTSVVEGANGEYGDPVFHEASIGCENCHGPGAAHIAAMSKPGMMPASTAIVNPSRLTPYMADNVCMACHQTGDVRVLKPGKSYADVRPGKPLDNVLSILLIPPTREHPPDADHVEHYYSMMLSKCYRASGGKLSCITCHDPHVQPTRAEAPAYFAKKCMTCHTNQSCKIPLEQRLKQTPANDCAGCHMPKRDIQVISHSSATNHRILARPDEPFPEETFKQTTASLPDLVDLDPAPEAKNAPLPKLTLLEAYGTLSTDHPEYTEAYLKLLSELEQSMPDSVLVQAGAGRRELQSRNYAAAEDHLRRAVKLGPPRATTYADLAEALNQQGRKQEALDALNQAYALDPFNPQIQKARVGRLIDLKQYREALAAIEHYVDVFPQDEFMRQMLARARQQPL
ncbi:tetratricopeptide repeat protein [Acidicapsa dinghuensis]|uniref:Tetratricopeptide repeat protein n=1 Tax=Acidicapsa dinghuensis TaxID=2218256 RepID=A0ABW1EDG3_9BACT|nr:tetratricopeptide repeat protein [Acidicapsa dinghuensis]